MPSNSGAFCLSPTVPGSTMYQTWITGTPASRQAAASRRTFSTAFCCLACSGAPESANAPPSMITSFCMSWMISAVRLGSSVISFALTAASPHVGKAVAAHLGRDPVHRRGRGDEQDVPVGAAPVEVADVLGHLHGPDLLAVGIEHAHAAGPGHPDVAPFVELHAVDQVPDLEIAGADALGEDA